MSGDDFESRLRASLHRHAQDAPPPDPVAERVLRGVSRTSGPARRREWRVWTLPVAAAAVVALVVGTVVTVAHLRQQDTPVAATRGPQAATPTPNPATPAPSLLSNPSTTPQDATSAAVVPADLSGVRILDATFVGPDDGWLLARADCLGQPGTCTAMLRTTDGGAHWTSVKPPPANVLGVNGCAAPCVAHIRFANAHTGYAYGDGYDDDTPAFFMTTDGGAHWTESKGVNVVALETLDNNVIRVTTTDPGCGPPGCVYQVQTAAIGSTEWSKPRILNSFVGMSPGAQLVRGGNHNAYVLVPGHPAGGGPIAFSALYRSSDDGQTWTSSAVNRGEPCPQAGGEVDSDLVAAGGGDRVTVVCTTRPAPHHRFLAVSTDGGAHFTRTAPVPWLGARFLVGDPATVLLAAGGSHVHRSVDGGKTWHRVAPGLTGDVSWAGFESATTGRLVAGGGRTIWTTRDGGATWTPLTFR